MDIDDKTKEILASIKEFVGAHDVKINNQGDFMASNKLL
jgi:hypothetical protein